MYEILKETNKDAQKWFKNNIFIIQLENDTKLLKHDLPRPLEILPLLNKYVVV